MEKKVQSKLSTNLGPFHSSPSWHNCCAEMYPSPSSGWGCRSLVDLKELQHSAAKCRLGLAYVRTQTHTSVDRRHPPKRRRRRCLCTLQTYGRARNSTCTCVCMHVCRWWMWRRFYETDGASTILTSLPQLAEVS